MAQERISKEQKQLWAAFRWFETTPNGKLILDNLKMLQDHSSHVKGDPYQTAYNEGRRSVYLDIQSAIEQGKQAERTANARTAKRDAADELDSSSVFDTPSDE